MHRIRRRLTKPTPAWKGPKPQLPMVTVPVYIVYYRDLEAYLQTVFKMDRYSIRSETGARGDMTPEIDVTGHMPNVPNLCQLVDNIRRGRRTRNLGLILDILCQDGFIPAGKYIINMVEMLSPIKRYTEALNKSQDCLHPVCIAIKAKNLGDVKFNRQVKLLDDKLLKHHEQLAARISKEGGSHDG